MKTAALISLFLTTVALADNGSSGVGNVSIPISEDFVVEVDPAKFKPGKGAILNADDDAPVLSYSEITKSSADDEKKKFVESRLGSVKAWEYLPDQIKDPSGANRWIVCSAKEKCMALYSINKNNRAAAKIIGTLQNN